METPKRQLSFFWAIILIGAGIIWLMVNLGILAPFSIGTLLQFWPLLLVLLGLDILFGRRYAWLGSLFGVLMVAAVIVLLVMAPKSGLVQTSQNQVDTYTEPLGEATFVTYNFSTASEPVEIFALSDESKLIDATIAHQGAISFGVTGSTNQTVRLYEEYETSNWFNWNLSFENYKWSIGLTPSIPADLILDGGSGSINADLSGVQLETLTADLGSGASIFVLPESDTPLEVNIDSGSGAVNVDLPKTTTITLALQSGSGSVHIDIPDDAPVRIEVLDSGSGSLSLPDNANRVSGDVETGAWETPSYSTAADPILIQIVDRGSGSISIN